MIGFEPTNNRFAVCPLRPLGHITMSNHRQEAVAAGLSTFLTVLVRSLNLPKQLSEIAFLCLDSNQDQRGQNPTFCQLNYREASPLGFEPRIF